MDRYLDRAQSGPVFLRQEALAGLVVESLLRGAEGYTAHEANRILGAAYIENNPVKAGLVSRAEQYRWSSAHETWRQILTPPRVHRSVNVARTSARATGVFEGDS